MLYPQQTINFGGQLKTLDVPLIMGIINVTADSFYAGSRHQHLDVIIATAAKMLEDGADIIDIGGMSSRPGADLVPVEEELNRVVPVIAKLKKTFPEAILSVDTLHGKIARAAVEAGAGMINDISAGNIDNTMFDVVAELNVPYVLMHMKGQPKTMQQHTDYEKDVSQYILDFLAKKLHLLRGKGVKDVIVDPGFGFGKSIAQNYQLLRELHLLKILDTPIMVGLSRKSMIYKALDTDQENALNGTTALNMLALEQGAKLLRVHDVRAAKETVTLWQRYLGLPSGIDRE